MQKGDHVNVCAVSGIPNKLGIYNDGYIPPAQQSTQKVINAIIEIDEHKYSGVLTEI